MKATIVKKLLAAIAFAVPQCCQPQGFLDLDFESANVSAYSSGDAVPVTNAFPDWSAYMGPPGNPTELSLSTVLYDGVTTGGALISLQNANALAPNGPIQGNYSAFLEGSIPGAESTASLGQIGNIPVNAESLIFWDYCSELNVSFDGQALSLLTISNTVNYTVYAADISSFAGETGQLLFTAPVDEGAILDNIQFSSSPVPEPGTLALCALGALSFALCQRKRSSA